MIRPAVDPFTPTASAAISKSPEPSSAVSFGGPKSLAPKIPRAIPVNADACQDAAPR